MTVESGQVTGSLERGRSIHLRFLSRSRKTPWSVHYFASIVRCVALVKHQFAVEQPHQYYLPSLHHQDKRGRSPHRHHGLDQALVSIAKSAKRHHSLGSNQILCQMPLINRNDKPHPVYHQPQQNLRMCRISRTLFSPTQPYPPRTKR